LGFWAPPQALQAIIKQIVVAPARTERRPHAQRTASHAARRVALFSRIFICYKSELVGRNRIRHLTASIGLGSHVVWIAAALAFAALSACAALSRKPFRCPDEGGVTWTRVTSDHFILETDLDRETAEATSSDLEVMLWTLSELAFRSPNRPKMSVEVVAFKDGNEYDAIDSSTTTGSFSSRGLHDFERRPVALVKGNLRASRQTFQHELTHFLVHYYLPQAPVWLNEGLAEYYETLDIDGDDLQVGQPTSSMRIWLPGNATPDLFWGSRAHYEDAPSPLKLMAMTPTEFYGMDVADTGSGRGTEWLQTRVMFYACAWALVHLFLTDDKYRGEFRNYLVSLSGGEKSDFAWATTLGALDQAKLEADFRTYLQSRVFKGPRVKNMAQRTPPTKVEVLSHNEVHLLWARLRSWTSGPDRDAARMELAHVQERDSGNMELGLLKAWWALSENDMNAAERALTDIAPAHQRDARVLNAKGWVKLAPLMKRKSAKYADYALALHTTANELAPVAKSAAALDLLGRYYAGRGNLDEGIAYEKRAVDADPNCIPCLSAAAKMLNEKGHTREALDVATMALGLLPDGTRSEDLSEQVATYQRAVSAPATAPAPSSSPSASTSAAPPRAAKPARSKPAPVVSPASSGPSR